MTKQDFTLISSLKDIFPEDTWTWAIPALKREPLIWNALQGKHFRDKAKKEIGSQVEKWTPARLGVISLNIELPFTLDWPLPDFNDLSPDLRQRIYERYQAFTEESPSVPNLTQALLLALALKQENEAGKTWNELHQESIPPSHWQGPYICLYELLDSPTALLKRLPGGLGTHILLSRPSSPTTVRERFKRHLSLFPRQKQLHWLEILGEEQPGTASKIAKTLSSSLTGRSATLENLISDSQLLQAAGDSRRALQLLERASSLHQEMKGSLSAQINTNCAQVEAPQLTSKAWEDVITTVKDPQELEKHADSISVLLRTLTKKKFYAAAENLIEGMQKPYPDHPGLLTALASFALTREEPEKARQIALRASGLISEDFPAPVSLSEILNEIGCFEESIRAALSTLGAYPNHQNALVTLARSYDQVGDHPQAIQNAQLAVLKHPDDIDLRREFASYLEHNQEWESALKERSRVLAKLQGAVDAKSNFTPFLPHEDLHALAACAYHAQQPNRAQKACQNILKQNPDDGLAHATLGKSLIALEKTDEGFDHLQKAMDLSPELPDPWLAMAQGQLENGEEEQAIQTLKMGTNAADKQAKIHLALGKIHDERHAQSKALEAFKSAAQCSRKEKLDRPSEQEIGYQLGKAYYQLGHLNEARNTLRDLKERFPGNQKTHYIYGRVLLDMDEPRGALPYLAQVVDTQPSGVNPYLDYADAHLRIGANPKIAIKSLNQALEMDPENGKGQALLAEAFAANGEFERALSHFQKVMDSELSKDPSWGPRITTGLGNTALNLGQTETALATLKEGFHKNPRSLTLAQTLAKAFAEAELKNNALETAEDALDIAPDDLDNLSWVADFALELGSPSQAIPALEEIINLDPDRTQTYIKLGKAHRMNKQPEKAKDVFSRISSLDHASAEGLYQAGDELLQLGDIEEGMNCLKKAAHVSQANPEGNELLPQIWARWADGHAMNGAPDRALDLMDKAISADLDQPAWRVKKADFLVEEERFQAALASLKNALDLNPQDPTLHYKTSLVYRQIGDYTSALKHAKQAVKEYSEDAGSEQENLHAAQALAADLASASAQPELALEILEPERERLLSHYSLEKEDLCDAVCLLGELTLDMGEEIKAAQLVNEVYEDQSASPRLAALQARILARQGNIAQARSVLEEAVEDSQDKPYPSRLFRTAHLLGFAHAFQELEEWDQALAYYQEASQEYPQDLRAQLEYVRALVRRAEIQRFARSLKVIVHAPGPAALSNETKTAFQKALAALKKVTEDISLTRKWELRGLAAFQPTPQTSKALEEYAQAPEDLAALLASLRGHHHMDQAAKRAIGNLEKLGSCKEFDAQVALSISSINPQKALEAANSALEVLEGTFDLKEPSYLVLKAITAENNQALETSHECMKDALQVWQDEPRWHALAAAYCPDPQEAINHLEKAIELEPSYAGHYLSLGKHLLDYNQPETAIEILEEAVNLAPEQVEAWTTLSRCHRAIGDLDPAYICAQRAVERSPGHRDARLLLAEISLERGEYQAAESQLQFLTEQNAGDPEVLALLSETLAAQGRHQQALDVIEKAISLDGASLNLKLQEAELIKEVDGISAAIDALRVIGSHYPDEYRVVTALVKALAEGGETNQAIKTAKTILSKDDVGHTAAQKAQLHLLAGRLLRKEGQLDQAVHYLNEAKKLEPRSHESFLELGRTFLDRREYDRALERLNKSIELAPDEAMGYFYAGKVLKELKEYERAERMLRQASKLAPNNLRIHRQLGVLVTLNLVHGTRDKKKAFT